MNASVLGDTRVGIIGAGVMAEAIVAGLLRDGAMPPTSITCADPVEERRSRLASRHGVTTVAGNAEAAQAAVVLLAVKPQVLRAVMRGLRGALGGDQLVLSIVAGATTVALRAGLGHDRVVRAMPNTPAQVGAGITVWCASGAVDARDRERTRAILAALGREVEVGDERQVTMATAVSGSGPAYVFLHMEALVSAAVHLGLPREPARELVVETFRGAAQLARATGGHLAELRELVTSPGGTTAAALGRLEAGALRAIVDDAVRAAYERTVELETGLERDLGHGPGSPPDPDSASA